MSISEKISQLTSKVSSLQSASSSIRTAIKSKGVNADSAGFSTFAERISQIQTGGGSATEGTVVLDVTGYPSGSTCRVLVYNKASNPIYGQNSVFHCTILNSSFPSVSLPAGSYYWEIIPDSVLNGYQITFGASTIACTSKSSVEAPGYTGDGAFGYGINRQSFTVTAGSTYSLGIAVSEIRYSLSSEVYSLTGFEGTDANLVNGTYNQVANTYKNGYPVFQNASTGNYMYRWKSNNPYGSSEYWVVANNLDISYPDIPYPDSSICYWTGTSSSGVYEPAFSNASGFNNGYNISFGNYYNLSGSGRKCIAGALTTRNLTVNVTFEE